MAGVEWDGDTALLGVVLFAWFWIRIDRFGQIDRAQRADVIVVLGAQVLPIGQAQPDLEARTAHAISLYTTTTASSE